MKKKIFLGTVLLAFFAVICSVSVNANPKQLESSNSDALASDSVSYWCCGNDGTCATGTDKDGKTVTIHGTTKTSPCGK